MSALSFAGTAFATEPTLAANEAAARAAIVSTPIASAPRDVRSTDLARNEAAAQHAIVDDAKSSTARPVSTAAATLAQNEQAARRVIDANSVAVNNVPVALEVASRTSVAMPAAGR